MGKIKFQDVKIKIAGHILILLLTSLIQDKMDCNLCGNINNTEDYYYCDVDKNGVRLDINEKKVLCYGSYEFVASTKFYQKIKFLVKHHFILYLKLQ